MLRWAVLLGTVAAAVGQFTNMNPGVEYTVSNPAPGAEGKPIKFYGKGHFTVDTPVFKSQYSQVVWHTLAPVPIPADVVEAYDGKVLSVTGWEVDVLRVVNGKEEHVPCYESYNHHCPDPLGAFNRPSRFP
jgi:hypothetical protein